METRLLAYESAARVSEIASWANNAIGKEVPEDPDFTVVSVLQFQAVSVENGYDALVLVEVTKRHFDTDVALKAADIEVIEELTSSIDEPI